MDRRLYDAAVSRGIDVTGSSAEADRAERPVRLLATATVHTPALLAAASAGAGAHALVAGLSAGLIRLGHHALAVHARDNGYDPEPWIAQAVSVGSVLALDGRHDDGRLLRDAADHLADAIVALTCDRIGVPDAIARAQGAWLSCFAGARAQERERAGCRPRME